MDPESENSELDPELYNITVTTTQNTELDSDRRGSEEPMQSQLEDMTAVQVENETQKSDDDVHNERANVNDSSERIDHDMANYRRLAETVPLPEQNRVFLSNITQDTESGTRTVKNETVLHCREPTIQLPDNHNFGEEFEFHGHGVQRENVRVNSSENESNLSDLPRTDGLSNQRENGQERYRQENNRNTQNIEAYLNRRLNELQSLIESDANFDSDDSDNTDPDIQNLINEIIAHNNNVTLSEAGEPPETETQRESENTPRNRAILEFQRDVQVICEWFVICLNAFRIALGPNLDGSTDRRNNDGGTVGQSSSEPQPNNNLPDVGGGNDTASCSYSGVPGQSSNYYPDNSRQFRGGHGRGQSSENSRRGSRGIDNSDFTTSQSHGVDSATGRRFSSYIIRTRSNHGHRRRGAVGRGRGRFGHGSRQNRYQVQNIRTSVYNDIHPLLSYTQRVQRYLYDDHDVYQLTHTLTYNSMDTD